MDMKKLAKSNRENIVKEVKSHSQMKHNHIVEMVDFLEDGDLIYLLLDFAASGNLFSYMNKVDLGHAAVCKIFVQVCLAIEHVHSKGYIHRDLKPENIFLDKNMNALLGDFGWCAHVSDTTYRYQTAGTYEYMSPEALKGRIQGREVDIWAIGILLYELFHNQEPFSGKGSKEVLDSIQNKAVEFFSDVPKEATDLIVKILVIDPKKRPSIREILSHPFVKKFYHDALPPAPAGIENFPQSPVSSRGSSPMKNKLNTILGATSSSARLIPLSNEGEQSQYTKQYDGSPTTIARQQTMVDVVRKPNTIESEPKLYPTSSSQRTITISKNSNSTDSRPQQVLHNATSMRVMPVMQKDASPSSPLKHPPRPPTSTMASREVQPTQKNDIGSPTRIIGSRPGIPNIQSISQASNRSIQEAFSYTNTMYGGRVESASESERSSPRRIVIQSTSNTNPSFNHATQITSQHETPVRSPSRVFNFSKPESVDMKPIENPADKRDSSRQTGSPRIVISSNKDHSQMSSGATVSRTSSTTNTIPNATTLMNSRPALINNAISLQTANMQEKFGPTQVVANSPIRTFEPTPLRRFDDIVLQSNSSPGTSQPRKTFPILRSTEIRLDKDGNTPPERISDHGGLATDRTAYHLAKDFTSGNSSPTTGQFRRVASTFQAHTTKNAWSKEAGTLDSNTNGSMSTTGSRRVAVNSQGVTHESLQAATSGIRHAITITSQTNGQTGFGSPGRDLLQRRTSDVGVGGSGSPNKEAPQSPVRRIIHTTQGVAHGGNTTRVEPLRVQENTNSYPVYSTQNGNLVSPLLRASPSKHTSPGNGDYSSFFMKKICSIDSNCSSEYDLSQASVQRVRPRTDSISQVSTEKPDLAKAMTAVVVGSLPVDRNSATNGATTYRTTLQQPSPATAQQQLRTSYNQQPSTQVPLYTIYRQNVSAGQTEVRLADPYRTSNYVLPHTGQPIVTSGPQIAASNTLRGSMNINYYPGSTTQNKDSYQVGPKTTVGGQSLSFQYSGHSYTMNR